MYLWASEVWLVFGLLGRIRNKIVYQMPPTQYTLSIPGKTHPLPLQMTVHQSRLTPSPSFDDLIFLLVNLLIKPLYIIPLPVNHLDSDLVMYKITAWSPKLQRCSTIYKSKDKLSTPCTDSGHPHLATLSFPLLISGSSQCTRVKTWNCSEIRHKNSQMGGFIMLSGNLGWASRCRAMSKGIIDSGSISSHVK